MANLKTLLSRGLFCIILLSLLSTLLEATPPPTPSSFSHKDPKQTWGYVEVRPGAKMFWWLYYTTSATPKQAPLVIWLQGGPGASSTGFGNFEEIGPISTSLQVRNHTWLKYANLLFIDSPVGTGFSYVNATNLLVKNNSQIASDLVEMFSRFLKKVPDFVDTPLYIFSESYGGKMAAQFALKLVKQISKSKIKCNFKGISLGDSWISPADSVLTWAQYLYSTSLVDSIGFDQINKSAHLVKTAIDKGEFIEATNLWEETENLISKYTNNVNVYNILKTQQNTLQHDKINKHLKKYNTDKLSALMNGPVRQMLRIIPQNISWGMQQELVFNSLKEDFMKPVHHIVENLLNNTDLQINVYSGQLDLIVDTMGTIKWCQNLNWNEIKEWEKAERKAIIINNSTDIFVKKYKHFAFYWMLKAGHMVPADAPESAAEMLQIITNIK